jgi:XTP/dITP diphosphohydrolase
MELVVGTRNAHKIIELERILAPLIPGLQLRPATGEGPVEDGSTFQENALIKARAAFVDAQHTAIADDSGMSVEALGGKPGIYSARYAPSGADADNTQLVLSEMEGQSDRRAVFVCAAAVVFDGGEYVVEAIWPGHVATEVVGEGGFGYDPIFIPEGETRTSAQLSAAEKDRISHRGQAFRLLAAHLESLQREGKLEN